MTDCAPQGNDPGYMWAMTVLGFWLKLAIGVLGACLTLLWLLQVLLYIFISPPLSPFLNDMFVRLDRVFPLFGTFAFALFCFYLIGKSSYTSCLLHTLNIILRYLSKCQGMIRNTTLWKKFWHFIWYGRSICKIKWTLCMSYKHLHFKNSYAPTIKEDRCRQNWRIYHMHNTCFSAQQLLHSYQSLHIPHLGEIW